MMSSSKNTCDDCALLRADLIEKDCEIRKLEIKIMNLNERISYYKNKTCQVCHCNKELKTNCGKVSDDKNLNTHAFDEINKKGEALVSVNKEMKSDTSNTKTAYNAESLKKSPEIKCSKLNDSAITNAPNVSDEYVFDENYKMYFCVSTGFYFDQNSGFYYIPEKNAYYSYDYSKNAYVLYNDCETESKKNCIAHQESETYDSINQTILNISSNDKQEAEDSCEYVVDKVNNLNLNDSHETLNKYDGSLISEEEKIKITAVETDCKLEIQGDSMSCSFSKAWEAPADSNLTVQDLVREVAEENSGMSDYVYDEKSQMYFSQSTGYYYDSVRKLLYDPQNGIYYQYNEDTASYDFYCQVDLKSVETSKKEVEKHCQVNEKVKARRRYWRKKQICLTEKIEDYNSKAIDLNEENYSSPEEGELFSSDSEKDVEISSEMDPYLEKLFRMCIVWATGCWLLDSCSPCIRAIVKSSEKLKIGTLILITCTGGIIGRDKSNAVYLTDITVSKAHAEIIFDNQLWKYSIKDLGSQNGTYVNDKRLSEPKECSCPHILNHGDIVSIGSCKLMFHIHVGYETCDECEPGQIMTEKVLKEEKYTPHFKSKEEKEKERRLEVKRLKKKYGLEGMNYEERKSSAMTASSNYEDKAELRRQTVGSDNPYEKTETSSTEKFVKKSNKGYQMLKKLGWNEGDSLGMTGSGISEPIPFRPWLTKAGLGSTDDQQVSLVCNVQDKKTRKWVKAQERFLKLC